uniref:Immunoglobulin V-set domain-containing protein n=1 Tax=Cyprinodon variegatus TaxID=28743 RepID=A0A3Q2EGN1_CYPVA
MFTAICSFSANCNQLTPHEKEVSSLEETSVTLSYKFSGQAAANDYFFWYRQYPGKPPEFLISYSGTGRKMLDPVPGFSFKVSDDKTQMDLLISSAALTDSAVYYCALQPTVTGNTRTLGTHTLLKSRLLTHMTDDKENRGMRQ